MTVVNAAGDGVYYRGYFYVGIKYSYKETREIKFQTLRRKSRSLGHAAMWLITPRKLSCVVRQVMSDPQFECAFLCFQ